MNLGKTYLLERGSPEEIAKDFLGTAATAGTVYSLSRHICVDTIPEPSEVTYSPLVKKKFMEDLFSLSPTIAGALPVAGRILSTFPIDHKLCVAWRKIANGCLKICRAFQSADSTIRMFDDVPSIIKSREKLDMVTEAIPLFKAEVNRACRLLNNVESKRIPKFINAIQKELKNHEEGLELYLSAFMVILDELNTMFDTMISHIQRLKNIQDYIEHRPSHSPIAV